MINIAIHCMEKDKTVHEQKCLAYKQNLSYQMEVRFNLGAAGLLNLGNTCYMNSGLQCLSKTWPLANYFLDGFYEKQVNATTNDLGSKGNLAREYYNLLMRMYYGYDSFVDPSGVKSILGNANPIFNGISQNDAHEFISEFLNGLHEDLNKIIQKPSFKMFEKDPEQSIDKFAQISWNNYLIQNQSIIVDLFHGQFLNIVKCPDCENTSYRVDQYSSIQLPIPRTQGIWISLFYIHFSIFKNIFETQIYISDCQYFKDIRIILANKIGVSKNSFIIARVFGNAIRQIYHDTDFPETRYLDFEALYMYEIDPEIIELTKNGNEMIRPKSPEITNPTSTFEKDGINIQQGKTNFDDYIFVPISFEWNYKSAFDRQDLIVPRLILINKNMSLANIHLYIFRNYYGFLENFEEIKLNGNLEDSFYKLGLNTKNSKAKPYTLSYIHIFTEDKSRCFFCGTEGRIQCPIPFEENLTINEILSKLNLNHLLENKLIYIYDEIRNGKKILEFTIFYRGEVNKTYQKIIKDLNPPLQYEKAQNIYDLLDAFIKERILDKENKWLCSRCKEPKQAKEKMIIYNAPPILILQLLRFNSKPPSNNYYIENHFKTGNKFYGFIDYPIKDLDLTNYCACNTQEMKYDLFAVCEHYSDLKEGGHYTSRVYNHFYKKWFYIDDSVCTELNDSNSIVSSSAYILFYRRKGIK